MATATSPARATCDTCGCPLHVRNRTGQCVHCALNANRRRLTLNPDLTMETARADIAARLADELATDPTGHEAAILQILSDVLARIAANPKQRWDAHS